MDCVKLHTILTECAKTHYIAPKNALEITANEAQKYNCLLLSNTIQRQCNSLAIHNETLYQPTNVFEETNNKK